MNDADKFITAQNEFQRWEFYPMLLAVKARSARREPGQPSRKLRRPADDLRRHVRKFRLGQKKWNGAQDDEQRVPKRALLARRPNCRTSQALHAGEVIVARRAFGKFIENFCDKAVQSATRVLPGCFHQPRPENDGQSFR